MRIPNELGISFIANPGPHAVNALNVVFIGLDDPANKLDFLLPPQHFLHPAAGRLTRAINLKELREAAKLLIEKTPFEAFRSALSSSLRKKLLNGEDVLAEAYPGKPPHPLGTGVALSKKGYAQKQAYLEKNRKTNLAQFDTDVVNSLTAAGTAWPHIVCRVVIGETATHRSVKHGK